MITLITYGMLRMARRPGNLFAVTMDPRIQAVITRPDGREIAVDLTADMAIKCVTGATTMLGALMLLKQQNLVHYHVAQKLYARHLAEGQGIEIRHGKDAEPDIKK
jgi:hypothetical protein